MFKLNLNLQTKILINIKLKRINETKIVLNLKISIRFKTIN